MGGAKVYPAASSKASEQIRSAKRRENEWRKGVSVCYRFVSLIGEQIRSATLVQNESNKLAGKRETIVFTVTEAKAASSKASE